MAGSSNRSSNSPIALVTGSSAGIGAATAVALAKGGMRRIVVHGRSPSKRLQQIVDEISAAGCEVKSVFGDFADTRSLDAFAEQAWSQFGGLDVLINNAGGDVLTGAMADADFQTKLDYLWQVDVVATLKLSRLLGRQMCEACGSDSNKSIVNIGWDQATRGMAGDSGELFATIKGAVMAMTGSLAQSFAPNVRVNCVAPGWIQTDWGRNAGKYWSNRAISESLAARWGTPQDVADAIAFLVSDQARFISGQILEVNGGFKFSQMPGQP